MTCYLLKPWCSTLLRINDKFPTRETSPPTLKFRRVFCMPKRHPNHAELLHAHYNNSLKLYVERFFSSPLKLYLSHRETRFACARANICRQTECNTESQHEIVTNEWSHTPIFLSTSRDSSYKCGASCEQFHRETLLLFYLESYRFRNGKRGTGRA